MNYENNNDWRAVAAKQLANAPMYVLVLIIMGMMIWLNHQRDMIDQDITREFIETFGEYEKRHAEAMETLVEIDKQESEFYKLHLQNQNALMRSIEEILDECNIQT